MMENEEPLDQTTTMQLLERIKLTREIEKKDLEIEKEKLEIENEKLEIEKKRLEILILQKQHEDSRFACH